MSWSKDKNGKWVWTPDGKGNPNVAGDNTTAKPTFTFGSGSTDSGQYGVLVGFGLKDKSGKPLSMPPVQIAPYIVSLVKTNPKAFANIKSSVAAATGKQPINDPNTLGNWVSRLAQNISASQDPLVKSASLEDFLRSTAATASASSAASAAANLPTRQIYKYSTDQISSMIDESAQSIAGRTINDADKQTQWYKDLTKAINGMIQTGTTTKTTTKGGYKVVETVPSGSQEQIKSLAAKTISGQLTEDVARKERVDFTSWMFKNLGVGNA